MQHPEARGEGDFPEMKAEGGGHIQVGVNVVHVMEAPEQRDLVIGHVPVIKAQVEQQEAQSEFQRRRQREKMEQAKARSKGPAQREAAQGLYEGRRGDEGQRGERQVQDQALQQRRRAISQWEKPLQNK